MLYVNKYCKKCGKNIYGFHTLKYCDICKKIMRKESGKAWILKQKKKERYCVVCKRVLEKGRKKFCRYVCNQKYNKLQKNYEILVNKKIHFCKFCGISFVAIHKNNIYCKSTSCQEKVIKTQREKSQIKKRLLMVSMPKKEKICSLCKEKFIPKNNHYKYCSTSCHKKRNYIDTYAKNKKKYYSNINYRLMVLLRTRFKRAIQNNSKRESVLRLIGCSIDELKNYLEGKFQSGMSWKNYGFYGWHIDHIKPCSVFDLTKLEEQKKCFHYSNLQPLWARDNLKKNDNFSIEEESEKCEIATS